MNHYESSLRDDLKQFFVIAIPLSAAYLAEFAMFLTTKAVVGKLGYHSLAAVGIASDLSFEILIVIMALLSVVGVLAAQAYGAGREKELGHSVKQGFFVATGLGIAGTVLVWNLQPLLRAFEQDPIVVVLAGDYLKGLSAAVLPVLWFSILRNFVAVLSKTLSVLVITVIAVGLNYLLTLWFVHGGLGLAPQGLFGAGIAAGLVHWFMFLAMLWHVYRKPLFRGFGIFTQRWQLHWKTCREILTLGTPVAGLAFLEAGLFVAVAVLSGIIGAKTLAAYQITIAWVGIPFVIALGMAEATMIRVAHAIGRNSMPQARTAGFMGMILVVAVVSTLVLVPLLFHESIVRIFIATDDPGFDEVSQLATRFLHIGALFMVFDALQAAAARALRGMKDNLVPLWIAGFGYWILGIGGGSLLAFYYDMMGAGLWWGLAAGLAVASVLLTWRFHRFTRTRSV